MTEQRERYRIYSHVTKSSFLHVEDALEIGKLRLFAGHYKKGAGSDQMTAHWHDVADARVLFNDLAWGKAVDYVEYKGTGKGDQAVSRVLKVKAKGDKVWFRLESGPGQVMGQGAVKPKGDPETVVNVPFSTTDSRKMAYAVLSYLQAAEVVDMLRRPGEPDNAGAPGGRAAPGGHGVDSPDQEVEPQQGDEAEPQPQTVDEEAGEILPAGTVGTVQRDTEAIQTFGDLWTAVGKDFDLNRSQALRELGVTRQEDLADEPAMLYQEIAEIMAGR